MADQPTSEPIESHLLRDETVYPSDEVLKEVLAGSFTVYEQLISALNGEKLGLTPQWNWYRDGKAWLCKICDRKKTIAWLSAWDGYFKLGFYFTDKHTEAIGALAIDPMIKADYMAAKPIGRLKPMTISVRRLNQLEDILRIIDFKKKTK